MSKKALAVALSLAMTSTMALAAPTAVTVNGKTISAQAQEKVVKQFVNNGQTRTPELEMRVRNQMIQEAVLLQEANRLKLSSRSDVRDALNNARDQVLIKALFDDFAEKTTANDAEVKKFYDDQKKAYGDKEYKISFITVKTEADAKKVVEKLKDGQSFDKVAKEMSINKDAKETGGKMDLWTSSTTFAPTIGYVIRNLDKNKFTEIPVHMDGVFHVIKVDDVRKAELFPSYDKNKNHYRNMLIQSKVRKSLQDLLQKAKIDVKADAKK